MTSLTNRLDDLFDAYSHRARLYPVLLTMLPLLPYALLPLHDAGAVRSPRGWLELSWPVLVAAGVPFLATNLVRSRGKATQARLITAWDGFPTTRVLRHRDSGPGTHRAHRRRRLEELLEITLPTAEEEARAPAATDHQYALAVHQLIARVRAREGDFPLVGSENAAYGFRRNLLGMKVPALVVLALCLVADAAAIAGVLPFDGHARSLSTFLVVAHGAAALVWLTSIRASWVREAADDYSDRLFGALDDMRLGPAR